MMSNLVSQLEIQKATDRLDEVLSGNPDACAPRSAIRRSSRPCRKSSARRPCSTSSRASAGSVISKEMKDYIVRLLRQGAGQDRSRKSWQRLVLGDPSCPSTRTWRPGRSSPPPTTTSPKRSGTSPTAKKTCSCTPCSPTRRAQFLEQATQDPRKIDFLLGDASPA